MPEMLTATNIMSGTDSKIKWLAGDAYWRGRVVARIFNISIGLAAVGWGTFAGPIFWRQTSTATLGTKIVAGERFKAGVLEEYLAGLDPSIRNGLCQPVTLRTLAIARLRLAEEAISDGQGAFIDQALTAGETALRSSLSCTPTDPFLWFSLFWMQTSVRGLQRDNFKLLRQSYSFGPNEGWLSVRRNRLAIAIYPSLPDDLKQAATDEFVQLVKSDFVTVAADILAVPGVSVRTMLLNRLDGAGIDERKLRFLSMLLAKKDIEVAFPNLDHSSKHSRNE
jgi:hypothetical protein